MGTPVNAPGLTGPDSSVPCSIYLTIVRSDWRQAFRIGGRTDLLRPDRSGDKRRSNHRVLGRIVTFTMDGTALEAKRSNISSC